MLLIEFLKTDLARNAQIVGAAAGEIAREYGYGVETIACYREKIQAELKLNMNISITWDMVSNQMVEAYLLALTG